MARRSDSDLQASWGPGQGQKTVEEEGRESLEADKGFWGKRSRCCRGDAVPREVQFKEGKKDL